MAKASTNTQIALPVDTSVPLAPMGLDAMGTILAKSGFFADSKDASQAVVKVLAGRELGIGPISAMTGINVIKGKVSLSANLIAGCIKRSGRYAYKVLEMSTKKVVLEFYEDGKAVGKSEFGEEDAKRAEIKSEMYKKFPANMFFARAMSNGAKWFCPDVFAGPVYTPEELGATVDADGEILDVTPVEPTKSLKEVLEEQQKAAAASQVDPAVAAATAVVAEMKAQGDALVAKAEGAHAEAASVAQEVKEAKTVNEPAKEAIVDPAAIAAASVSSASRVDQFKAKLVVLDFPADPVVKKNVELAISVRQQTRFSALKEGEQDAILAWLADLVECQALVKVLKLTDEQVAKMLLNHGAQKVTHLLGPTAVKLAAALRAKVASVKN